jgi:hypothetical protein
VEIKSKPSPGNGCVPDYRWVLWECRLLSGGTQEILSNRFRTALNDFNGVEKVTLKIGRIAVDCFTGERLDYEDFLNAWATLPEEPFRKLVEQALIQTGIKVTPIILGVAPTPTSAQVPWAFHRSSTGRATSILYTSRTSLSASRSCCSGPRPMGG